MEYRYYAEGTAECIRGILERRKLQQIDVAALIGAPAKTISGWCNGVIPPSKHVETLKSVLDLSAKEYVLLLEAIMHDLKQQWRSKP